jgi:L-threonylcarbamoyladenylate synthase
MKQFLSWDSLDIEKEILPIILSDGVIAMPTDTVFGLCGGINQKVFYKLNEIKRRPNKPYLILIHDKQKLAQWVDSVSSEVQAIIDRYWPGPLTIIFKAKKNTPRFLVSEDNTIAVRVPDHKRLQEILTQVDGLFSTSANKAGEPIAQSVEQLDPEILAQIDAVIAGEPPCKQPSTIIDATQDQIKVIREGACNITV